MPYKDIEKRREWQRNYYYKNIETQRLRGRTKHMEHKEEYNKKGEEYRKNNLGKFAEKAKKYRKNHPNQIVAQQQAQKIKLKNECEVCGTTENLQRHHWDYNQPMLINTLCQQCHTIQHL